MEPSHGNCRRRISAFLLSVYDAEKNSVDLPWTFDVSYKLNGVEADASKLAGASGLVEVNVKGDPE